MAKTIAFIDNFDEVEIFLKTFSSCVDANTVFIAGDALAFEALKKRGIQSRVLDDYRNRKEYVDAEISAVELAGKWFIDSEGNDLTEFESISLGKSLKKEAFNYFYYLLKAILDVSNILKYENPEKVLLIHDYPISNDFIGKRDFFLHKKVFQFLKKDKKYDVCIGELKIHGLLLKLKSIIRHFRFEKHALAGKITYFCPAILNRFIKKLAVITVDQMKRLLAKNVNKLGLIRTLTLAASDLTYFGTDLIESFLRKGNCYLYYLEDENNCYFNSKILHVITKRLNSITIEKKITKYLSELKSRFEKIKKTEKKHPHFVFLHLPLFGFIDGYLKETLENEIPELIKILLVSDDIIKRMNINIVLISERWGAKRIILTEIAKRNGLSVLHIPHGVEAGIKNGEKIISHALSNVKFFPFYPTHEISSFKYYQEIQEDRGIGQNQLFLTGIPRFGHINRKTEKDYDDARRRLGFSCDEEIVLFVIRGIFKPFYDKVILNDQISTFTLSYLYESFIEQFSNRKNCRIVFKLKMLDAQNNWLINNYITKSGSDNVSIFKNNLHDLLIASDAVVVTHSNIGIEAIYHDTPVIVYNDPNKPSLLPLCAEGAAIEIKTPEELMPVLDKLRDDKEYRTKWLKIQRNFLLRNLPDDNLSSAERVSNVIIKLASNKLAMIA